MNFSLMLLYNDQPVEVKTLQFHLSCTAESETQAVILLYHWLAVHKTFLTLHSGLLHGNERITHMHILTHTHACIHTQSLFTAHL